MNCYYSNLIEGHNTHPIDIERAMRDDYSDDLRKRDLQLEARAHITVQKWIDDGNLANDPFSSDAVIEIHKRFCELLPPELLIVEGTERTDKAVVVAGEIRMRDVQVGRHIAISPGAVPRFLTRMTDAYRMTGRIERILSAACGHHRLLWVHPFLDGNGRVARLVSYAVLRAAMDTRGLWSVARGLARREKEYKAHLQACDEPRRGSLDGRGSLSEAALAEFTAFFLETCIDQIDFMSGLMQPNKLRDRILVWAAEEIRGGALPARSDAVLTAILYRGELERGEVAMLTGLSDRSARRITSALIDIGVAQSSTSRAPLRLAFPARLATRFLPGLFPGE
jgi:Fic family protein